jgi:hypothetical protein
MGSCWPHKKSNLLDSYQKKAQDKRNLEVKDAAKGYLTPEEPNESQITRKRSFNSSCLKNTPKIQQRSKFYLQAKNGRIGVRGFRHLDLQQ